MSIEKYATQTERRIAEATVDAMLAAGWSLSVFDGEEYTVRHSRDRAQVLGALATTSDDRLFASQPDGARVGFVWLVWGNGCDLLSDWSDVQPIAAMLEPVLALCEQLDNERCPNGRQVPDECDAGAPCRRCARGDAQVRA